MSRSRVSWFFAAALLVLGACTDDGAGTTVTTTGPGAPTTTTTSTLPATVPGDGIDLVRILDGDSLIVAVDGVESEVRLLGINAPEASECFGDEAEAALSGLLDGRALTLEKDAAVDKDQYGRLLRYLYADEVLVNEELVTTGQAMSLHFDHRNESRFHDANDQAFEARRGMWATDACGPVETFGADIFIDTINYNPPGPDDPNGEWLIIRNRDDTGVDFTGWTVRDESSTHRFVFPEFVLSAGDSVQVYVGCGEDTSDEFHWCADGTVWNNGGDTALLLDSSGNVVDRYAYDGDD